MQNFKNPEIYNLYFSIQENFKSVKILGVGESEKNCTVGQKSAQPFWRKLGII